VRWLRTSRSGSVSVETALVVAYVLAPLCMGAIDVGMIMTTQARLDRALQAAAQYAWNIGGSATAANIQSAAQTGYGGGTPALTASAALACYCVTATATSPTAVACTGSCTSPKVLATYVTLTATTALSLPVPTPIFQSPMTLSASGTFRIQ